MKKSLYLVAILVLWAASPVQAWFGMDKFKTLTPQNDAVSIPLAEIGDGKAHYYRVQSEKGLVDFFVVKSVDGIFRAAVDACDVCFRSGKGYEQEGNDMVCQNCGMRFATDRINEVKGGCNPAPLDRKVEGGHLLISMADINANAWLCQFKH